MYDSLYQIIFWVGLFVCLVGFALFLLVALREISGLTLARIVLLVGALMVGAGTMGFFV